MSQVSVSCFPVQTHFVLVVMGVLKGCVVTTGTPAFSLGASRMHVQTPLGAYSACVSQQLPPPCEPRPIREVEKQRQTQYVTRVNLVSAVPFHGGLWQSLSPVCPVPSWLRGSYSLGEQVSGDSHGVQEQLCTWDWWEKMEKLGSRAWTLFVQPR